MSDPFPTTHGPRNLVALSRQELASELAPLIDRSYRLDQVYLALHRRGVARLDDITELSLRLREQLAERFYVQQPEIVERQVSADDTCKYLLRLHDGATIEAVDIPESDRRTLCISSQAGCALACTFCVTGYWGAGRNLSGGEILAQVRLIDGDLQGEERKPGAAGPAESNGFGQRRDAERPTPTVEVAGPNIVFMGMGEPLLNLEAVRESLEMLSQTTSWRRITVSTVGIVPALEEMARWKRRPNLAVSLHAPDDARRNEIMPINRTHPLAELMDCLQRYPLERGRKITIEYVLIRGFNDREADADATARLLRGLRAKVNLIPINPDPVLGDEMVPPDERTIERFQARLRRRGLFTTVRRRRGDEVHGACGQLRAFGSAAHGVSARRQQQRDQAAGDDG
jgi:23S rRNA (adenine2503-C2)-methyltransferase